MINPDFETIFRQMQHHGMKLPATTVPVSIPHAPKVFTRCFTYFLSQQGREYCKIPEYDKVTRWLGDNGGKGLFLWGGCGLGKSFIIRYILPAILLKYERKVVSVFDAQEMNGKLDEVLGKHIISLDDIGTEDIINHYGNKREAFAEITDAAEKYGKLLLVSTNLNPEQLSRRYGERVVERIIATTRQIEFRGKSLRK